MQCPPAQRVPQRTRTERASNQLPACYLIPYGIASGPAACWSTVCECPGSSKSLLDRQVPARVVVEPFLADWFAWIQRLLALRSGLLALMSRWCGT